MDQVPAKGNRTEYPVEQHPALVLPGHAEDPQTTHQIAVWRSAIPPARRPSLRSRTSSGSASAAMSRYPWVPAIAPSHPANPVLEQRPIAKLQPPAGLQPWLGSTLLRSV